MKTTTSPAVIVLRRSARHTPHDSRAPTRAHWPEHSNAGSSPTSTGQPSPRRASRPRRRQRPNPRHRSINPGHNLRPGAAPLPARGRRAVLRRTAPQPGRPRSRARPGRSGTSQGRRVRRPPPGGGRSAPAWRRAPGPARTPARPTPQYGRRTQLPGGPPRRPTAGGTGARGWYASATAATSGSKPGARPIASSSAAVGEDDRCGRPIRAITRSTRARRRACASPSQKRGTMHRIH